MTEGLADRRDELRDLSRHALDGRVRYRAHLLLAALGHPTDAAAARALAVNAHQLRRWRARFLAEGGAGLANRTAPGRARALDPAAEQVLRTALDTSPLDYGYGVATWTVADLTHLLAAKGWAVHRATVYRTLHRLGYVYRRPRHDLQHRQDAEAVASAAHTLDVLQKKGLLLPGESGSSILMNAICTPTPTWQNAGNDRDIPAASGPPARTSG